MSFMSIASAWPGARVCTAAVLCAAAASTFAADDKTADKAAPQPALTVTVAQASSHRLTQQVSANGSVAAWQEAIVSAEANGARLARILVAIGNPVKRGQVMAELDSSMVSADLAQTKAAVAEAQATLAEAQANAQRARSLQGSDALSQQQISQYLTAERTAQARLEAQRAAQKVQELRLKQMQILAPDDGVVSARTATLGAVVAPGQELFRLIRKNRLEWRAEVAANDLARIAPGQKAQVLLPNGPAIEGTVRVVAPTVDAASRNGLVYVDLPSPGPARPGMFARGDFTIGASEAMTLPQSAVLLRDGFSYVFVVDAASKVRQAKVSVGRRQGDQVELTGGLPPQARVVASGAGFLSDGDVVRVVTSPPPVAPVSASASAARK